MILEYYDFDKGFYDDGKRIYYPDMKDNGDCDVFVYAKSGTYRYVSGSRIGNDPITGRMSIIANALYYPLYQFQKLDDVDRRADIRFALSNRR